MVNQENQVRLDELKQKFEEISKKIYDGIPLTLRMSARACGIRAKGDILQGGRKRRIARFLRRSGSTTGWKFQSPRISNLCFRLPTGFRRLKNPN